MNRLRIFSLIFLLGLSALLGCSAPSDAIKTSVGEDSWETLKPSPVQVRLKPFEENKIQLAVADQVVAEGTPTAGTVLPVTLEGRSCGVAVLSRYAYTQSDYPASLRRPTSRDRLVEHQYRGLIVQLACADGPVPGTDASHRGTNSRASLPWALPGLIFGVLCGLYARSDREGGQNLGATFGFGFLGLVTACTLAYRMFDGSYVLSMGLLLIAFGVVGIIAGALWEEGKRYRTIVWVLGAVLGVGLVVWKLPVWTPGGPLLALLAMAFLAVTAIVIVVASEKDDLQKYRKHQLSHANGPPKKKDAKERKKNQPQSESAEVNWSGDEADESSPELLWDANGKIVLAYHVRTEPKGPRELVLRTWDKNQKTWETYADTSSLTVQNSRLALTSGNQSVVAFEENKSLWVKVWDGGSWKGYGTVEQALNATITRPVSLQSLAVTPDGKPTVAYCEGSGSDRQGFVKQWDGFFWTVLGGPVNHDAAQGLSRCEMALDAAGQPIVAFEETLSSGKKAVFVKQWSPAQNAWTPLGGSLNADERKNATKPKIILGTEGGTAVPIVAFLEDSGEEGATVRWLSVKRWDGKSWIPLGGPVNADPNRSVQELAMARDSLGRPFVFFSQDVEKQDGNKGKKLFPDLFVRRWDGLTWENLGNEIYSLSQNNVLKDLGISLNASDRPALVYGAQYVTASYRGRNKVMVEIPDTMEGGALSASWERIT